ncbi:MAG TPA: hypothetical protein VFF03_06790 [Rhodocyclaceae bacterium]|nr:hypothetical protein [Rhodocyclaceae bacterium]
MHPTLRRTVIPLAFAALLSACGTLTNPTDLARPAQVRHLQITEPLLEKRTQGLLSMKWEYYLLPGRYVADRQDAQGVYYRGPSSSLFAKLEDQTEGQFHSGGFWMPFDPAQKPRFFAYMGSAQRGRVAPASANRPMTVAEGAAAGAVGGAIGGAAGGVAAHAVNPKFEKSYGQAAGTGAGAGLVAGALIGAIIASEEGKIAFWPETEDERLIARLRDLTAQAVPLNQPFPTTVSYAVPVSAPRAAPLAVAAPSPAPAAPAQAAPAYQPVQQAEASRKAPARKMGAWSYRVEQYARSQGCQSNDGAWLIGEHRQGIGRYEIDCGKGAPQVVTCDASACKFEAS